MIPKIIHYCWFGGNPLPPLAIKCIDSWKKHCPDYEIKEWNERNFDINIYPFAKEAYEAKKWAFVSDVARLHVLYYYGGVYMDTDVEVLKPLDQFLTHNAFSGYESEANIPTGIIGSVQKNAWINRSLNYYNGKYFKLADSEYEMTPNTVYITEITKSYYNFCPNNKFQDLGDIAIYPIDFFCPKPWELTHNSYTIHHFMASWRDEKQQRQREKLIRLFGVKYGSYLFALMNIYRSKGIREVFSKIKKKLSEGRG